MKVSIKIFIFFFIFNAHASPSSYLEAKKIALNIFNEHPVTIYCACEFDANKNVNLKSCNLKSFKKLKRAKQIEWEHIMPAENFGRHFKCWRENLCETNGIKFKGRKCCQLIDDKYREIEAELFNLWPAVGIINQLRGNYKFSPLEAKNTIACDIKIDKNLKLIEPPDSAKGIVARANLFVSDKYHIRLSSSQRKLFKAWHKQFPPTKWEMSWARKVAKIQGYSNPYYHLN